MFAYAKCHRALLYYYCKWAHFYSPKKSTIKITLKPKTHNMCALPSALPVLHSFFIPAVSLSSAFSYKHDIRIRYTYTFSTEIAVELLRIIMNLFLYILCFLYIFVALRRGAWNYYRFTLRRISAHRASIWFIKEMPWITFTTFSTVRWKLCRTTWSLQFWVRKWKW